MLVSWLSWEDSLRLGASGRGTPVLLAAPTSSRTSMIIELEEGGGA